MGKNHCDCADNCADNKCGKKKVSCKSYKIYICNIEQEKKPEKCKCQEDKKKKIYYVCNDKKHDVYKRCDFESDDECEYQEKKKKIQYVCREKKSDTYRCLDFESDDECAYQQICCDEPEDLDIKCKSNVRVENLVSNLLDTGYNQDPDLINSWGIAIINNIIWVVNNLTSTVTTYDLNGNKIPTVVTIINNAGERSLPTGIVQNKTNGFTIQNGGLRLPATWLVATENGTINAYNSLLNPTEAVVVVDNSASQSMYTGLTIANNYLYAADFYNNKIDVFDSKFMQVYSFPFVDNNRSDNLPNGFAPYNIANVNGFLYVLYALQRLPDKTVTQPGVGNGYINIFCANGTFVKRFVSRGALNSPWGIIAAPKNFCLENSALLVGNYGDGYINVYGNDGNFLGRLQNCDKVDVEIPGLHGLAVNNNVKTNQKQSIYFASGPVDGINGLVGRFTADCKRRCDCDDE